MRYEIVEFDFIERTLSILKQYKECYHIPPRKEKYTTTLMLNCLIGLLIFPYETNRRKVSQPSLISFFHGDEKTFKVLEEEWEIPGFNIEKICDFNGNSINCENASIKLIIYRMRNCIAHSNWEQNENKENDVLFYDTGEGKDYQGLGIYYKDDAHDENQSKIISLVFTNVNNKGNLLFKATISVEGLEKLMIKFAESVLEGIKPTKLIN